MDRTLENPRSERFSHKHEYERIKCNKDIALQSITLIDDDGTLKDAIKEVVVDEAAMLKDVNPVTTRIQYMMQYGTLQKDKIVSYGFGHSTLYMSPEELKSHIEKIVNENSKN